MIPVLFSSSALVYTTNGIGKLKDCISCTVTEERNGEYELQLKYPASGAHYSDIQLGCWITAIPSPYRDAQPFRIYSITRDIYGTATIKAEHRSYRLAKLVIPPLTSSGSVSAVLAAIKNAGTPSLVHWTFSSDMDTTISFSTEIPRTVRSCLLGATGSVLDLCGSGEWLFDNSSASLMSARGSDCGAVVRYGKNLTSMKQLSDNTDMITGVYPYYSSGENVVVGSIQYVDGQTLGWLEPLDLTENFEEVPTAAQLNTAAQAQLPSLVTTPETSLSIEMLHLSQTLEYKDFQMFEQCDLCDTITIVHSGLGITETAKITKIETNVLTERYNKLTVGTIEKKLTDYILR